MTARSTGSASSASVRTADTPATASPERFTGYAAPAKPAPTTLRKTAPPIEPSRAEAPMTARLSGEKNGRSEATTAT